MRKISILAFIITVLSTPACAQLFTMSNSCYEITKEGETALSKKDYSKALDLYSSMKGKCKSKDGLEAAAAGKAEALNGLNRYDEAMAAADEAIKASKNTSLKGYFQKAVSQNKLGQFEASRATFQKVLDLTEKNKDTKTRANNYSLMGQLYSRQLSNRDSGFYYMNKAIELDGTNPNFYIQRGDIYTHNNEYEKAFADYDKAVSMGKTDMEMYQIRTEKRIEMVQKKYDTTNAQELGRKMTDTEKQMICTEQKKAKALGMKNMQIDMFAALICQ